MKLAVICPPAWIRYNPLTFHMVLGQHIDREYVEAYQEKHERGDFILVDTGAAEGIEPEDFMDNLAIWLPIADEVVVPDKFEDPIETFTLAEKYAPYIPPAKRMIVPHGKDSTEWFESLEAISDLLRGEYASIGIGRYSHNPHMREAILDKLGFFNRKNLHLLGARANPMEDFHKFAHRVRSIDTGAPIAWAQKRELLEISGGHASLIWDQDPDPADYDAHYCRLNITAANKACHGKD